MGTIDEIKRMQGEGKNEAQIIAALRERGISDQAIREGLTQAKIKEAVSGPGTPGQTGESPEIPQPGQPASAGGAGLGQQPVSTGVEMQPAMTGREIQQVGGEPQAPVPKRAAVAMDKGGAEQATQEYTPGGYEEMQPSVMGAPGPEGDVGEMPYPPDSSAYGAEYGGPQYQPYAETMSSDVITEISEQVVSEKLALINDKLKEAIDFKTVAEARVSSLSERLVRLEKIIDRLQLSVLHKVGEYIGDVKDIKHELFETQKSFKALAPGFHIRSRKKQKTSKKKKKGP